MSNGVWNRLCPGAVAIVCLVLVTTSTAIAQQSFRQFDRNMVVTPAELFEAISGLYPSLQRPEVSKQRLEEIEKAGLKLLSELSPEKREQAWKFAEKHLRKNGVDSASSKKLMQEFGLPPEMYNELSKQLRKFGGRRNDSGSTADEDSEDAISRLLQKAKEEFRKSESNKDPQVRSRQSPTTAGVESNSQNAKENAGQNTSRTGNNNRDGDSTKPGNRSTLDKPNRTNGSANTKSGNSASDANSDSANRKSSSRDRSRNPKFGAKRGRTNADGNGANSEAELEKLLKQLNKATQVDKNATRPAGSSNGGAAATKPDADLENLIEKLADVKPGGEKAGFAQDLISKALGEKGTKGKSGAENAANSAASSESIGTRFDRLLVKAVDRTLTSDNDQGVSRSVGGVLGGLIEKFQDRAKEKKAAAKEQARAEKLERRSRRNRSGRADSDNNIANNQASRNSGSPSQEYSKTTTDPSGSIAETLSSGSGRMADMIPDLSGINPTQVIAFFALVGIVLFVGYLLAQTIVGDETEAKKREVIKRVRNTKIRTPKDLVETVDIFLLAKFGIKSSWWNAKLAQQILHSQSPGLQAQVDELFRDYVRARYMRDDIEIPDADQLRYKQTLEELSKLDMAPQANVRPVSARGAMEPPAALEG